MVIFSQAFRNLLIQTNLVGNRVYLMRAPQGSNAQPVTPYVVFFPVSEQLTHAHSGPLDQVDGLYQVSIFDTSQTRALAIGVSMRQALSGLVGNFEQFRIGACIFAGDTFASEDEAKLFHVIQEYRISYSFLETATTTAV